MVAWERVARERAARARERERERVARVALRLEVVNRRRGVCSDCIWIWCQAQSVSAKILWRTWMEVPRRHVPALSMMWKVRVFKFGVVG